MADQKPRKPRFRCPMCGHPVKIDPENTETTRTCLNCGELITLDEVAPERSRKPKKRTPPPSHREIIWKWIGVVMCGVTLVVALFFPLITNTNLIALRTLPGWAVALLVIGLGICRALDGKPKYVNWLALALLPVVLWFGVVVWRTHGHLQMFSPRIGPPWNSSGQVIEEATIRGGVKITRDSSLGGSYNYRYKSPLCRFHLHVQNQPHLYHRFNWGFYLLIGSLIGCFVFLSKGPQRQCQSVDALA